MSWKWPVRAVLLLCALSGLLTVPSAALALVSSSTGSQPSATPIVLGTSLTDGATVTGNGVIAPTGTVNFSVCGPGVTACLTGGQAVGTAQTLLPNLDLTSSTSSASFTPNAVGTWCFRGDYNGDTVYDTSTDGSADECFTVSQASSGSSSTPQSASIALGGSNTDNITVTGNTAGDSPTGTVNFFVCGPPATSCASGGTSAGSATLTASGDGKTSTASSSPAFTPTAQGTYCFRADYVGDTNYTGSSDGSSGECFTVGKASSSTGSSPSSLSVPLGGSNTDTVTVTGNSTGGSPSGTVNFFVCDPPATSCASGGTSAGSATLTPSGDGKSSTATSSPAFTPSAQGTYCFRADYQGDSTYTGSSDGSSDECFSVGEAMSSTTSAATNATVSLGGSNTDGVTVTGNSTGGSPSGAVNFFVCGPPATSCASGGTSAGSATLTPSGDGKSSTATSSPAFTPSAQGTYCFRAEYHGDSTYSASSDGSSDECFTVGKASSSTSSSPSSMSVPLGSSDTDKATVTGNSTGGSPTGTVNFFVCGPPATSCASGGTSAGSAALTASGDGKTSTATSSPAFTPTALGTYCFRADYQGDPNYNASSDGSSSECFTVGKASSTTSSTPTNASVALGASNTDGVTVTGNSTGGSPTGTVNFSVCGPLTTPSGCATGGTSAGSATLASSGDGKTSTATSSPAFTASAKGTYCFRADYQGDSNYTGSTESTSGECFTVGKTSSGTTSAPTSKSIALGSPNTDSATVTGNITGGSPGGTVNFFVCGPPATSCASGGASAGSATLTASGDGKTSTATSSSFRPSALGTYCFRADYQGDPNYNASSDGSSGECFTVGKATATVNSVPQSETTTEAGSDADNTTVTGNTTAGPPTGTVNFSICGPMSSPSGCASGGTSAGSATLTASGGQAATATSPAFQPTASGVYCFRADYQGDGNYNPASDANGAVSCFTVPEPDAPSAQISSPKPGSFYARGQSVAANYSCSEASGGPGIASCSGNVPNGSNVDTSALGNHTFTVTAKSKDGKTTPVTVGYTVAAAPSATITSPKNGATYTLGTIVSVGFGCSEGQFGSGLAACVGPSGVDTNSLGTKAFSVTATSTDGQHSTSTVNYNVVRPSNQFRVARLRGSRTGQVNFRLSVPGGGKVSIVETAPRSALPKGKPKKGRLTFAKFKFSTSSKTTLKVSVKPNAIGRSLVKHHRFTVRVRLSLTFTPINGTPRTKVFTGLRVSP